MARAFPQVFGSQLPVCDNERRCVRDVFVGPFVRDGIG